MDGVGGILAPHDDGSPYGPRKKRRTEIRGRPSGKGHRPKAVRQVKLDATESRVMSQVAPRASLESTSLRHASAISRSTFLSFSFCILRARTRHSSANFR